MRTTLENNFTYGMRQQGSKYAAVSVVLSGDYVIPLEKGATFHFLDPGGADRSVYLPDLSPYGGQYFMISHRGVANTLSIRDDEGVLQTTLSAGQSIQFFSSPYEWVFMGGTDAGGAGSIFSIEVVIERDGAQIATGIKGDFDISFDFEIQSVTMLADRVGSIVVDIWKDTYANYPPNAGDSITGSAKPTITADDQSTDSTLLGWTTTVSAGDTLRFNVDSNVDIRRVTLSLTCMRT